MALLSSPVAPQSPNRTTGASDLSQALPRFERQAVLLVLSSALSHEINQPLTAIMGYAQTMQIMLQNPEVTQTQTNEALGAQLNKLLDQALRLRDIVVQRRCPPGEKQDSQPSEDLHHIVGEALNYATAEFGDSATQADPRFDPGVTAVTTDAVAACYLFVCLFRNAFEAMRESRDKRLVIETRRRDAASVEVAIADGGRGISPNLSEKALLPFVTDKPGHLGLGLASCQRIASNLGGTLTLESPAAGGALVIVTLPLYGGEGAPDV